MKQTKYLTLLLVILAIMSTSLGVKAQDVLDDTDNNIPEEHESIEHNHDIENNFELNEPEETLIDEEETIQINDKQELMPEAQTAPDDWAFEASSKPLNDAIIRRYPKIDKNGDGYISMKEADDYVGGLNLYMGAPASNTTMNGIENFKNITDLYLYGSMYIGNIPVNIGNLQKLTSFKVSMTQVTGDLPESIWNLTKVTYLDLSSNQLSGEIPESIGNLTNLTHLDLAINQLSGEIPESIGNLTNMTTLDLGINQLSGEIPESIGNLTNLTRLDLTRNQLSGTIPESIGNLTNLTSFYLSSNQLSGTIPETIINLTKVTNLQVQANQLTEMSLKTYNFIKSRIAYYMYGQKKDLILDHVGSTYKNYSFAAYPAYTQFPEYDNRSQFTYDLKYPDSTSVKITPTLKNGNLIILGKDLTQAGTYVLTASIPGTTIITGGDFRSTTYITRFNVDRGEVAYLSVIGNGEANKETTNTLTIAVDGTLDAEDVRLSLIAPKENETITKGTVREVDSGVYEVAVSGQWEEGREVKVELVENDNVIYTPSERTTVLHTVGSYTLSFDSQGGSSVADQFIEYGKLAIEPSNPTKTGHMFAGWYTDTTWTHAWNFDKDVVTDNLTLYAKWDVNQYDVYFKVDENTVIEQLRLAYGSLIEKPVDPERTSYVFAGWYKDTALTQEWDFNSDTISGVTFLYAKWNLNEYEVHFVTDNGVDLPSIQVNHGETLDTPAPLTKEGHTFGGWYTDTSWTQVWNFDQDVVIENLTLYARWEPIDPLTHVIEADDVELTISDVLEFDEERFLQLTNATIKRNDAPSLFSMVDTLGVLEHNIVAEPGEYYAVIAAQANADVQTEVKVTVVADNPDAGSEAGKSEDNVNDTESMLPQTGIESSLRGLELLILGGFLLFWNRRRKEMQ